ncbi:MAG: ABC-F family ATP-binding cassette domain-containing protein [Flavobacteriaceae bacterium]|nr:ABC-F family ATP-binding cassette domain-containing protein [Flavobacteriaceae bacterium]
MLSAQNIGVSFGGFTLFDNLNFRLGQGDRVALIGKNGAGKSTLLKLIAQEQSPTSGSFAIEKQCKIGYLPQDLDFDNTGSVLEESYKAFEEIIEIEQRQDIINHQLEIKTDYESDEYADLIIQLTESTSNYELLGGYQYKAKTERILLGLGFKNQDFHKPTKEFSGGWRMRIELAKLLLNENDILLLDEPTNHLDIDSIIWLEQFLMKYKGAVLLVSHDRIFLDRVTNRTIEIVQKHIFDFKKSYSEYLKLRHEIIEQQKLAKKNQDKQIQDTEKLIERFRAKASKASMAQSLIKKLDKIDRIEVDQEEIQTMKLNFPVSKQPGKIILETDNVSKQYGENIVFNNVDLLFERGSKIAFVGQNGQGKSTLARIIVGEIKYQGSLKLGHNVEIGYFAQNQSEYLNGQLTILETVQEAATENNRSSVRDLLGAFLFRGDDVDKKVSVLSGGERNRLSLCKLLLQPFNVLVMDEPTNHLDIASKDILKQALKKFQGTLILVSHDRDFLDELCSLVLEFKTQKVKMHLGGVKSYLEDKQVQNFTEIEKDKTTVEESSEIKNNGVDYSTQKQINKTKNRIKKLENKINSLEKKIKTIDLELEINYEETIASPDFFDKYHAQKKELQGCIDQWEADQYKLEKMIGNND